MRILFLEDDYLYAEEVKADLSSDPAISQAGLIIDVIASEREFRERFNEIANAHYDLAIVDVMVTWEGPRPDRRKPDQDVLEGGLYRAGLRCLDMLREDPRTKGLRVIVHTNLTKGDGFELRSKHEGPLTRFVPKSDESAPLTDCIRGWMAQTFQNR